MRREALSLLVAVLVSACSSGDRGMLEPLPDPGIELISTHGLPDDTARLRAGGVTADVTGRWSDQGESVEIEYVSGPTPARIAVGSGATWNGETAPATAAWDLSTREPGNAIGRPLLGQDPLRLAANERKRVQIEFDRTEGKSHPAMGDEVAVTIPMPGGAHVTRFRIAGE